MGVAAMAVEHDKAADAPLIQAVADPLHRGAQQVAADGNGAGEVQMPVAVAVGQRRKDHDVGSLLNQIQQLHGNQRIGSQGIMPSVTLDAAGG